MKAGSRRRWMWTASVAVAIVLPAAALLAGTRISSPAQRAADAAPPAPSAITVKAEERVLRDVIVTQGDITASGSTEVVVDTTDTAKPVVSDVRKAVGDQVAEGEVVVVVSGRPIIVLEGPVPAYRDLQPDMSGGDVTQLRAALDRLGYSTRDDPAGELGLATQAALRSLYADRGFTPVLTSDDATENLDQARRELEEAQRRLAQAQQAAAQPRPTPTAAPAAAGDGTDAAGGRSADASATSPSAAETAGPVPTDTSDLRAAVEDAQRAYQHLLLTTGVTAPRGELVFIPSFPAAVTSSRAVLGGPATAGAAGAGGAGSPSGGETGTGRTNGLLTLSSGQPQIVVRVQPDQVALVRQGSTAKVRLPSGDTIETTVDAVGDASGAGAADAGAAGGAGGAAGGSGVPVVITGASIPRELIGRNTMVTIESAATAAPVLAVPSAAVSSTTDGKLRVTKLANGQPAEVEVDIGATAGGWVEIRPRPTDAVRAGDEVVVGTSGAAAAAGAPPRG